MFYRPSVSNQLSTKFCTYEHNSAYDLHRSAVLVSNCSPGFPQQYSACPVPIQRSECKREPPVSELFQTVSRENIRVSAGLCYEIHAQTNLAVPTLLLHAKYIFFRNYSKIFPLIWRHSMLIYLFKFGIIHIKSWIMALRTAPVPKFEYK